jgi:arsenite-transporting ATPase
MIVAMRPRTILCTGKGGVGKTSVAAATARRCAADGLRTLVLSTDPAHSLGDVLAVALDPGPEPTRVGERLWAEQVAAQAELERHWAAARAWAGDVLAAQGVERITAEELAVPPGADELFCLLRLQAHHASGAFDVVVVDCAPTGETLRLLSFPDAARWWLERVQPRQGALLDAARPIARALLDVALPGEAVLDEVGRLVEHLVAMHELLRDRERVSVRLVMTPDRVVVEEARRTFTYLNLYGFLTDAVVVNRVFPAEVGDYFAAWRDAQAEALAEVEAAFAPVPVLRAPYLAREVRGPEMLDTLGDAVFGARDAAAVLHGELAERLELADGAATLRIALPFAARGDVDLKRRGPHVTVRVNGYKRTLMLPGGLAAYRTTGATLRDGALEVSFAAD